MPLTVGEALKLNIFQECRLLTGPGGLDNVIVWVNILEILDDLSHIEPGELLITTAHGFKKSDQDYQKTMIELFAKKKLAAVAIQTGHYVQKLPDSFIALARAHAIPVIEIPPDISFKRITRALIGRLVENGYPRRRNSEDKNLKDKLEHQIKAMNFLWRELTSTSNPKDYHHELAGFGLAVVKPITVAVIAFAKGQTVQPEKGGVEPDELIKQAEQTVTRLLEKLRSPYLLSSSKLFLTLLIQGREEDCDPLALNLEWTGKLTMELKKIMPGRQVMAGLSCLHPNISSIRQAIREAEQALQAAGLNLVEAKTVLCCRDLGLYRLIMDSKNLETLISLYNETVAPLLAYDEHSEGALLKTLHQYLVWYSIKKAAEKLYIHRHTMKYRLEQVRKMTGLDPLRPGDAFKLNVGLHIYRYLSALKMLP